jgi:hypothetical protein
MAEFIVQSILVRPVTKGDFWNIERGVNPARGGGQTYVDIPLGGNLTREALWTFLNTAPPANPDDRWPTTTISPKVIGTPSLISHLEFAPRQGNRRYKISNQARQKAGSQRHPAWTAANGFPQAPDDLLSISDPRFPDVSHLTIYLVKTVIGDYYAGFVNAAALPESWPQGIGIESFFQSRSGAILLSFDQPDVALVLDPDNKENPFRKLEIEVDIAIKLARAKIEPARMVTRPSNRVSPVELEKRLERQKEIGVVGELIAYRFELSRLLDLGVQDPDRWVEHVSVSDAALGFDIRSNPPGEEVRYIEVKSSTTDSDSFPFFITKNEIDVLREYADQAYLYFVRVIDLQAEQGSVIRTMQNPIQELEANAILQAVQYKGRLDLT